NVPSSARWSMVRTSQWRTHICLAGPRASQRPRPRDRIWRSHYDLRPGLALLRESRLPIEAHFEGQTRPEKSDGTTDPVGAVFGRRLFQTGHPGEQRPTKPLALRDGEVPERADCYSDPSAGEAY